MSHKCHAQYDRAPNPQTSVKPQVSALIPTCNAPKTPAGYWLLLLAGSRLASQSNTSLSAHFVLTCAHLGPTSMSVIYPEIALS